jgi:hypothetical protein
MKTHVLVENQYDYKSFTTPLCGTFKYSKLSTNFEEIDCGRCLRLINGYTVISRHLPRPDLKPSIP